jgi:hypothetical protein
MHAQVQVMLALFAGQRMVTSYPDTHHIDLRWNRLKGQDLGVGYAANIRAEADIPIRGISVIGFSSALRNQNTHKFAAANTIDEDANTYWQSAMLGYVTAAAREQWITYDLGGIYSVRGLRVFTHGGDNQPYSMTLQASPTKVSLSQLPDSSNEVDLLGDHHQNKAGRVFLTTTTGTATASATADADMFPASAAFDGNPRSHWISCLTGS